MNRRGLQRAEKAPVEDQPEPTADPPEPMTWTLEVNLTAKGKSNPAAIIKAIRKYERRNGREEATDA